MAEIITHADLPPVDQHAIVRWLVADLAALNTLPLDVGDRHKVAFVADTSQYYILVSAAQAIWKPLANETLNPIVDAVKDAEANAIVFTYKDDTTASISLPADENSVVNVSFDEETDILVFTYKDGTQATLDLASEAVTVVSAAFDEATETLTLTMSDNSTREATIPSGGGLEHLVETLYVDAPNDVVTAVQLKADGAAVDIALALSPKGNGPIQAQVADGTTAGGTTRGANAVDLQRSRGNADQVASGSRSVIVGGLHNKASGLNSFIGGGAQNTASGSHSILVGGYANGISGGEAFLGGGDSNEVATSHGAIVGGELNLINSVGLHGFIGAGKNNRVSHQQSSVVGGENNVASGQASVVLGGFGNTASTVYSAVLGGNSNEASGSHSLVFGSNSNASGAYSVALGSGANAIGIRSAVFGGNGNYAYGMESAIIGGNNGNTRNTRGMLVCSASYFATGAAAGNAQRGTYVLGRETTDGSPLELLTYVRDTAVIGESTDGSTNVVWLPDNSAYTFRASIVAQQDTGDTVAWEITGLIKRGVGVSTTTLVGTPAVTELGKDAGATAWGIAVSADTTLGALMFTATGEAAKTIHWVATVETTQVTF